MPITNAVANGSGSGTTERLLNERSNLLHHGTQDLLREEIQVGGNGNRIGYGGTNGGRGERQEKKYKTAFSSEDSGIDDDLDISEVEDGYSADRENEEEEDAAERGSEGNRLLEGDKKNRQHMGLLFPAVALGVMLSAADQTIIVSSYGKIGSDLNALNSTSWIATAYFLTLTSFQPLYGKVSDIFGRKAALLFAYSIFGIGCLFCGLARNIGELVAARAFAGIGGGGMTTVVSILFSDIIPLRERGTWQGYMNIVWAFGASMGAPLGGILADSIGWRWAFIGQFPVTLIACATVYFVLELPEVGDAHWITKLKRIDFLGAFTLIAAVFCLLVGLDRGSNVAWKDSYTLIFCLTSIPLFAIFIWVEMKVASHPFAPGHIIFQHSLLASYLCNFFVLGAYMGIMFYVPLYFQAVDGMTATAAGSRLIPVMICSVSGSLFGGQVMQRTGRYYWLTVYSMIICILGGIVIFVCSSTFASSSWGITIGLGMLAFGGGSTITTTLINVIANADPKDQAIATACTYLFRSLGSVVGVSMSSTVVQQALRVQLMEKLDSGSEADEIVEKVRQSLDFIKQLEPYTRELVRSCYGKATNAAFGVSIGVICLSLAAAMFIREKKLGN